MFYETVALLLPAGLWFARVHQQVPEPYLDEVFHVPQAQRYCAGHWASWDPKITTPPGLYVITLALQPILGCNTAALRLESAFCLLLVAATARLLLVRTRAVNERTRQYLWTTAHHAINMALFPPLFFFSALYYTDVASTLSVLVFHYFSQKLATNISPTKTIIIFTLGMLSLLFRQTNIFWVAIFPAAITFVRAVDSGHDVVKTSMQKGAIGFGESFLSIIKTSWKMKVVYDPPIAGAAFSDYCTFTASLVACSFANASSGASIRALLRALTPHIALIITFAGFVLWNGSVVLGDKSNHVATIHLPQMLYIWPYIMFFSWPLIWRYVFNLVHSAIPISLRNYISTVLQLQPAVRGPRMRFMLTFVLLGAIVVKYNTIIHPFTLADNRHYTFYVFRLLMRPWWVRYAVIPAYALCAWACIQAFAWHHQQSMSLRTKGRDTANQSLPKHLSGPRVSFVLIWLAASTLQLISAPLVEPRYFVLPWIFWRLAIVESSMCAAPSTPPVNRQHDEVKSVAVTRPCTEGPTIELCIETAWYLLLNAITGYIFLEWKFTWLAEPGKWQRFMW